MKENTLPIPQPHTPDTLDFWAEAYFHLEVSTQKKSVKEQRRDISLFLDFMREEEGGLERIKWTPRLSGALIDYLQSVYEANGERRWSNRTINRIIAHLKTWTKWIHKLRPFPLGNPMEKIHALPVTSTLEIERALTPSERRRMLDAADRLLLVGGRSRNRRYGHDIASRPVRKGYRPYRNRAIIYTLIETGMRRSFVCRLNLAEVDFDRRLLSVQEKGRNYHTYRISRDGL